MASSRSADAAAVNQFIEDMARALEATGTPWIAGAIVGYLCVSPEPDASQAELADHLGSSIATVSAMVRRLVQEGTLERVVVPGQRSARYRLVPGSYLARLDTAIHAATDLVALADKGLALPGATVGPGRAFLHEFRDVNEAFAAKITEVRESHSHTIRRRRRG